MNIIVLTAFPAVELVLLFAYLRRGGPESRPRTFGLRCAVSLWNVLFGIAILVLLAEDADWPTVLLLVGLLFGAFHDMFSFQAPRIPKKHRDARSRNRFFSHITGFLEWRSCSFSWHWPLQTADRAGASNGGMSSCSCSPPSSGSGAAGNTPNFGSAGEINGISSSPASCSAQSSPRWPPMPSASSTFDRWSESVSWSSH